MSELVLQTNPAPFSAPTSLDATNFSSSVAAYTMLSASLQAGLRVRLLVNGSSMLPLARTHDAVWVEWCDPARLRRGDIIVVRYRDELLTHRLIAVDAHGWHTKGDNCRSIDPPTDRQAIVGYVAAVERDGALIDLRCTKWTLLNALLGWSGAAERRLLYITYGMAPEAVQRTPWAPVRIGYALTALLRLIAHTIIRAALQLSNKG